MLIAIPCTDMGTCCKAMAAILTILVPRSRILLFDALRKVLQGRGGYPGCFSGNSNGTDTTIIYKLTIGFLLL